MDDNDNDDNNNDATYSILVETHYPDDEEVTGSVETDDESLTILRRDHDHDESPILSAARRVLRAELGAPPYETGGPGVFYGEWEVSDYRTGAVERKIVTFSGLGPENETALRRLVGWGGR